MRVAVYARYSSIEDQIEVCRGYAAQHGLEIVTRV